MIAYLELNYGEGIIISSDAVRLISQALALSIPVKDNSAYGKEFRIWKSERELPSIRFLPDSSLLDGPPESKPEPIPVEAPPKESEVL